VNTPRLSFLLRFCAFMFSFVWWRFEFPSVIFRSARCPLSSPCGTLTPFDQGLFLFFLTIDLVGLASFRFLFCCYSFPPSPPPLFLLISNLTFSCWWVYRARVPLSRDPPTAFSLLSSIRSLVSPSLFLAFLEWSVFVKPAFFGFCPTAPLFFSVFLRLFYYRFPFSKFISTAAAFLFRH